ncbi:MAG: hypothetical protein K8R59_05295 [Thermoanaerobaculales bacterium]|nr:hypothetical protein [Thermoanaerobaculales bacterium]
MATFPCTPACHDYVVASIGIRSKRRKMIEGMQRSLSDLLHERMAEAFRRCGSIRKTPENTSAIYAWAAKEAPGMLDQLFLVHLAAAHEKGEIPVSVNRAPTRDRDRKRMLSAVRASVARTRPRFRR